MTKPRPRSPLRLAPLRPPETIRDLEIPYAGFVPGKKAPTRRQFRGSGVTFIAAGRGRVRGKKGNEFAVRAGEVYFLPPKEEYTIGPDPGATWDEYYLGLLGPGLERLRSYGWLPIADRAWRLAETGPVVDAFWRVLRALDRAATHDYDLAVLLAEQLLFEIYCARADVREKLAPARGLAGILRWLERHYARPVDFEALAAEHAMSYSALRQQFVRVTGRPPGRYLSELRCQAAAQLLLDTDLNIGQVARKVGIEDPFVFSKLFKRHRGLAPRPFRQRAR